MFISLFSNALSILVLLVSIFTIVNNYNFFLNFDSNESVKVTALQSTTSLLNNFVEDEIQELAVEEIKFEDFFSYSATTCTSASNISVIKKALLNELKDVPPKIIDSIISKFSNDSCISSESRTSYEGSQEVAFIYWHLSCSDNNSKFNLCVSVSGANVVLAEVVVGTIVEKENRIIGYEPCKCTLLNAMCRDCPIVETKEHSKEVKRRPQLTLKQHEILANTLHRKAVKHAQQFLDNAHSDQLQQPRIREPSNA